jgi:hypothetical protein
LLGIRSAQDSDRFIADGKHHEVPRDLRVDADWKSEYVGRR